MPVKLGELLLKENMVTPQQLQEALSHQKMNGGKLGKAFVTLGFVKDEEITSLLSRQYGVPSINLDHFEVDPAIIKIIPAETARKYQILPLSRSGATLTIAMADPTNVFAMDDIKFMTGYNVEPVVASEIVARGRDREVLRLDALPAAPAGLSVGGDGRRQGRRRAVPQGGHGRPGPHLRRHGLGRPLRGRPRLDGRRRGRRRDGQGPRTTRSTSATLAKSSDAAPVVKLSNVLLVDSLKRGASDIHIEPYEKEFRVRFRIDGILYNVMALPMKLRDPLTSRIKIMAKLDIAEKRLPQDGRIKIKLKIEDRSRDLDFRVSCLPTLWGEKIVLRLLDKTKLMLDMTKLGFEPDSLERFKRAIAKPYGIVLVTGPTGSGKTNTLYSAIAALNKPDTNIMTAEDPVEFNLPGINQVQIRENIGLNFAAALRSFLRQDPNIILVGEIRDYETAEIAVKAALTGHLVLSTLHTNDAPSTVSRLVNMGIEPFLVGTAVNLIQAQRLVRRVCANCKDEVTDIPRRPSSTSASPPSRSAPSSSSRARAAGPATARATRAASGLYEVMEITEGIRDLIMVGATAVEIKRKALEEGMLTLRMSGLEKIKAGITTIEEVLRETVL